MFKSSENLRLAAEMRALERVARPWREARTSWFDGTPESIEARLASTERVLTYAKSGFTQAHLALTREAAAARAELVEARHRLLTDFLDDGARTFRGSRRVAKDSAEGRMPGYEPGKTCMLCEREDRAKSSNFCSRCDDEADKWVRSFKGSKRVASELNWDDEDPELARLREETGWDEDGDSDVHPNAREDVPDPRLLSNFDKFVQSGELPSADAMREDIARWTGKEGSSRIAERGLRECINCGGGLSGEEDDDKESECPNCGMSAHKKGVDWRRKSHRTAAEYPLGTGYDRPGPRFPEAADISWPAGF